MTEACVRVSRVPVSSFDFARLSCSVRARTQCNRSCLGRALRSILNPGGNFVVVVDDAGAQHVRKRGFEFFTHQQGMTVVEAHLAFHASHGAEASAYSACMHRPDAETVSFTRVKVTGSEVVVRYSPASPCRQYPRPRPQTRYRSLGEMLSILAGLALATLLKRRPYMHCSRR